MPSTALLLLGLTAFVPPAGAGSPAQTGTETRSPSATTAIERLIGPTLEESVLVVGDRERPTEGVPGSVAVVDSEDILRHRPVGVAEALRRVPGVNVRTEDSNGLLPSIGLRGLNPDRSEKLLILEDGLPAALAPYNENAAYYAPPVERMERIEFLKGSGSILHGPQTVGGVLNYVTRRPPATPSGSLTALLGTDGYGLGHIQYGGMKGSVGYDLSGLAKTGDGFQESSGFSLASFTGKLLLEPTAESELVLKANWQEHESESTYLGLTRGLFAEDPSRKTVRDDLLEVGWKSLSAVYRRRWAQAELSVATYWVDAKRNWNRQDFARNTGFAGAPSNTVETLGDLSLDGGAIYLRESFGSRDRNFEYWGLEPRLMLVHWTGRVSHTTWLGLRYHSEDMVDARNNSTALDASKRTRHRELREVDALALFAQHELLVDDKLAIIPGLRYESSEQRREFTVKNFDPSEDRGDSSSNELIPGLGLSYRPVEAHEIFFGVHRGYAPPRTSEAINSSGEDLELDAERSWNWELGWRGRPWEAASVEVTAFLLDFENQIVPANESGGASTASTNAGRTRHQGIELAGSVDLLHRRGVERGARLLLSGGATLLGTENLTREGLFHGKDLPYAPELHARVGLDWIGRSGVEIGIEALYTAEQFADQANTVEVNEEGTTGELPAYSLVNLHLRKRFESSGLDLFVNVNNLLDRRYVASRAPEGSFPGAFRQVLAGLRWTF